MSLFFFNYISIHLSIYIYIHLSTYLFIFPSIYLSIIYIYAFLLLFCKFVFNLGRIVKFIIFLKNIILQFVYCSIYLSNLIAIYNDLFFKDLSKYKLLYLSIFLKEGANRNVICLFIWVTKVKFIF